MLGIVPLKGVEGAKMRLAPLLAREERAALVARMLEDVLAACRASRAIRSVLVVTPEPERVPAGLDVIVDGGEGHAPAVLAALADPRARRGALVVMADLPLATPQALDRLAAAAYPVALAPARDGGLNALALRDPALFEPVFGVPDAARLTAERARTAGFEPAIVDEPGLALDIDEPCDLRKVPWLEACA